VIELEHHLAGAEGHGLGNVHVAAVGRRLGRVEANIVERRADPVDRSEPDEPDRVVAGDSGEVEGLRPHLLVDVGVVDGRDMLPVPVDGEGVVLRVGQ
jgi:hypothetical protein